MKPQVYLNCSQQGSLDIKDGKQQIDLYDLYILQWFKDFQETGKMKSLTNGEEVYYLLCYNHLLEDCPMLRMKKRALIYRMNKLVDLNVLTHYTLRDVTGSWAYYGYGRNFTVIFPKKTDKASDPCNQLHGGMQPIAQGVCTELHSKDNPSTYPPSKISLLRGTCAPYCVEDVKTYCQENGLQNVDAEWFIEYYRDNDNRLRGGKLMTTHEDWQMAIRAWSREHYVIKPGNTGRSQRMQPDFQRFTPEERHEIVKGAIKDFDEDEDEETKLTQVIDG